MLTIPFLRHFFLGLEKPASLTDLVSFISDLNITPLNDEISKNTSNAHVIILDDEEIYLSAWKAHLEPTCKVTTYLDTSFLVEDIYTGEVNLDEIEVIVSDYYFKSDDVKSNKIGEFLRKKGFKGKLILSSNGIEKDLPEGFDKAITKDCQSIEDLLS